MKTMTLAENILSYMFWRDFKFPTQSKPRYIVRPAGARLITL